MMVEIFVVWVAFIISEQKPNVNHIKKYVKNFFCYIVMPSEDTKLLGLNHYKKSDKPPFFIQADLEYLIKKINGCKNNPEK